MSLLALLGLAPAPESMAAPPAPPASLPAPPAAAPGDRGLSDLQADVDAVVNQITALVLGGIDDDPLRAKVNADLDTLKAAIDKAGKMRDRKSALTALNAVLASAQALHARADAIKAALGLQASGVVPAREAAAKAIATLTADAQAPLLAELAALDTQARSAAEAGDTATLQSQVIARLKAIPGEIATQKKKATNDPGIAELRKRVDALASRTAKASETPVPMFVAAWQTRVRDALANFSKYEAASDLKSCEIVFSNLGASLDSMEAAKRAYADLKARLAAAKSGGIAAALATKLVPATLATLRQKSIDAKEADIVQVLEAGDLVQAGRLIDAWLQQAKTWGKTQATYNNLRSGHPKVGAMRDLIAEPGGGEVFDALVADLPEDTAGANVAGAIEARFDIEVEQFNHRKAKDAKKENFADDSRKTNPKEPQKGLKELYKILRKVPVTDVKYTEKITDYLEQAPKESGGYFQPGVFNDEIVMYAGRPDDATNTVTLGNVVASGETPDPNAAPVGGAQTQWYSFAALHEVGHGVDDARHVMKAHMAEAGWASHGTGEIAIRAAIKTGYDADYIESMMDSDGNKPPKKRPPRPSHIGSDSAWDSLRKDAELWVTESRETSNPWDDGNMAKRNAIGGRVYHESYAGKWVSYQIAARSKGIRGYQFRAPGEWFAELYAAYHSGKLNPAHPATPWLAKLKAESQAK